MDSFENQIITAIKKIRNWNKGPDAEKFFIIITKEYTSNLTLDNTTSDAVKFQAEKYTISRSGFIIYSLE